MVGACEIDKHARQIYSKHFPGVRIWEDAREIKTEELPDFDILVAGFPCQAFSLAGKRLGFEDTRGTLFYEIARIANKKRPRYILLENVRGILYHDEGRTLTTIIKTFYELGYDIEWQVINSKYFVPQNRERIFIIGHFGSQSRQKIFPIGEVKEINVTTQRKAQEQRKRIRCEDYTSAIDANYAKGGGSRTMLMIRDGRDNRSCLRAGRVPELGVTGESIRSLTPIECERLQGFPDNWTEGVSNIHRYRGLGNAVTVPVIEYILDYIMENRET